MSPLRAGWFLRLHFTSEICQPLSHVCPGETWNTVGQLSKGKRERKCPVNFDWLMGMFNSFSFSFFSSERESTGYGSGAFMCLKLEPCFHWKTAVQAEQAQVSFHYQTEHPILAYCITTFVTSLLLILSVWTTVISYPDENKNQKEKHNFFLK